jgi:2-oxoglutarate ferredoxin oxidoreductase subunit alpha
MTSKLEANLDHILQWEEEGLANADVALVSYGASARAAQHVAALARERGIRVGWLKLLTVWPFPEARIRALAAQVPRLIVPEMNLGQIRLEVERLAAGRAQVQGVHRADGLAITPEQILAAIEGSEVGFQKDR